MSAIRLYTLYITLLLKKALTKVRVPFERHLRRPGIAIYAHVLFGCYTTSPQ
jgi:hypothetical protein